MATILTDCPAAMRWAKWLRGNVSRANSGVAAQSCAGGGALVCGRYVSPDEASIEREFNLVHMEWQFPASFNVAPTEEVPVIRVRKGMRQGVRLHWGLIPYFAQGVPPKYSTINARIETLQTAASYRGAWNRGQRCLVPARGFYEWQTQSDGKRRVPYYIHLDDQEIFAFAGLWDRSRKADGTAIESCVHITMPANDLMRVLFDATISAGRDVMYGSEKSYLAWRASVIDTKLITAS